jgi:MFS family permease
VNGLAGNLGLALAAVVTGYLVKHAGWRAAFAIPGLVCLAFGVLFIFLSTAEASPPAKKKASGQPIAGVSIAKLLFVMTLAATSGSLNFNFSTNANYELLVDRFQAISRDPAQIGLLLAFVYAAASLTQLVVGNLLDRYSLKGLYLAIIAMQGAFLLLAMAADGMFYASVLFMAALRGDPVTDAMIVRFVDIYDASRVAGCAHRLLGASSLAVAHRTVVKQAGFTTLLGVMVAISAITFAVVSTLPDAGPEGGALATHPPVKACVSRSVVGSTRSGSRGDLHAHATVAAHSRR